MDFKSIGGGIPWVEIYSSCTTPALATHTHTVTAAGTNSTPSFTGNAVASLPPFLVVFMFQRAA